MSSIDSLRRARAQAMVVALATADRATFLNALWGKGDASLTDVVPFVYLLFLGWLVLAGPGVVALAAEARARPSPRRDDAFWAWLEARF